MPTTAAGTAYTVHTATVPGAGTVYWAIADTAAALPNRTIVIPLHGAAGAADQFTSLPAWKPLREKLIDNGKGYVECSGAGSQPWGNQASQDAYNAAFDYIDGLVDIAHVIVLGRSMGGLTGARLYNQRRATDTRFAGLIENSGVQDLAWAYDYDSGRWTAAFNTAWGVTSKAQLLAASVGMNPADGPASAWDGANVLQLWGTSDTTVPAGPNGQAMRTMYAGHPAYDAPPDIKVGGDHSSSNGSYGQVDPMWNFILTVIGETPPTQVPQEGYRSSGRYIFIAGLKHLITSRVS